MVEIRDVSKLYGHFRALDGCTTSVTKGRLVVVCGASRARTSRSAAHIGMVFQTFERFPHRTVIENLDLARQVEVVRRTRGRDEAGDAFTQACRARESRKSFGGAVADRTPFVDGGWIVDNGV